jgi:phosphate transport system substrate-binding protein
MATLLSYWEKAFCQSHPNITFEDKLFGPASAMAGIYTGVADLSWMGHEILTEESMGFEWVYQYKALGVQVATASLDKHSNGAALVVFVHRDNPLGQLSLEQLDAIFGSEHRRGSKNIRTWGELGLTGDWASRPIHAYGYAADTEGGAFFRQSVLANSYKWSCDLKELANTQESNGKMLDAGPRILQALKQDRYGIAYSKLLYRNDSVRALSLAENGEGPYFAPVADNLRSRNYPLSRAVRVYLNRPPGKPWDSKLEQFLKYVLSPEGQQQIVREGGYFPLSDEEARAQLRKIE